MHNGSRCDANFIVSGISVRKFPDDYLAPGTPGDRLIMPKASEISMYRELEGVYLLLDGSRIFFNSQQQAKYAFYSAINGSRDIIVPESREAARATKNYLSDLQEIYGKIVRRIESMGCTGKENEGLFAQCLELLGIARISENP